jgi:hypothetical protein
MKATGLASAMVTAGLILTGVAKAQHCPRAINHNVNCQSQGCWGTYESGYCGAPNDQNQQCQTYRVTC